MDELVAPAKQQLERVKVLCAQTGLKYLDLPQLAAGGAIDGTI